MVSSLRSWVRSSTRPRRCSSSAPTRDATCRAVRSRPSSRQQVRDGRRRRRRRANRPEHVQRAPPATGSTGAAVIGYERRALGAPESSGRRAGTRPAPGEGVANETDASEGFGIGDVVRVEPGGYAIRIVGQSSDTNLQASPTVFVRYDTWEQAVRAVNPDARTPAAERARCRTRRPGVTPEQLVRRGRRVSTDLEALTRTDAATRAPGVAQVSRSFLVIFLLYGLVIPLVIGLFFLIVTLQKARSLTLLRAIGARSSFLVRSLLLSGARRGRPRGRHRHAALPARSRSSGSVRSRCSSMRSASIGWGVGILVLGARQLVVLGAARLAARAGRGALRRGDGLVRIALREMRRRPGRFATATALLTLIAMLLMLLGGLLDGLINRATGCDPRAARRSRGVLRRRPSSRCCAAASPRRSDAQVEEVRRRGRASVASE